MKSLKTLLAVAFLMIGTTVIAQETSKPEYQFKKHAFLNLEGGAQYTLGEAKFDKLISPNVQLGIGYQFNPWFAARIQANGWQSKGGWNGYTTSTNAASMTADYKYKYVAPGIDFMFNLSNLFFGYNPTRVFNVTAFLGGGANIAFDNDEVNDIAANVKKDLGAYELEYLWDGTKVRAFGRGGVELGFRLSNAVSLIVEGNANVLNDHYNSKKAGNADWYFNALAGFRINLGKTYTKKEQPAPEPAPAPVVEEQPAPAPAPVAEVKIEPIRRDVFFTINSTKIVDAEDQKVKEIVDYLNKYPNAKVTVTGYADAGTGNDKINDRIAAQRANIVAKSLVEKYSIPAERIVKDSKGSRIQPFAENDKNRVSICIAE